MPLDGFGEVLAPENGKVDLALTFSCQVLTTSKELT